MALTKHGSLTSPRYSQRLSRLAFRRGCDDSVFRKSSAPYAVVTSPSQNLIVAGGPDDPGVPSLDFLGRQRHAAVHVAEIVFVGGRKRRGVASDDERLVADTARLAVPRCLTQRNNATPAARHTRRTRRTVMPTAKPLVLRFVIAVNLRLERRDVAPADRADRL